MDSTDSYARRVHVNARVKAFRALGLPSGLMIGVLVAWLSFCGTAGGTVWHVDGGVPQSGDGMSWETALKTIQEGIDSAANGDTVIVAEGTYLENIHFHGKNITLRSTDPFHANVVAMTIIDGDKAGSAVTFGGAEGETCALSGFTIRNGSSTYGGGICGGTPENPIRSRAAIRHNIITGNSARYGGGIALCDGVIENNAIRGNSTPYHGGGLYGCDGTIRNNTIAQNSATSHGGGLYQCGGTILSNRIAENSADEGSGGGFVYCSGTIRNNLIVGNSAGSRGGGIALCDGTIENNTVSGNSTPLQGGGLYGCKGTIQNSIISGNGVGHWEAQIFDSSVPTYSCIQDWPGGGEGNISAGPEFVDPDGADDDPATDEDNNYHLAAASPCLDAGKNVDWMSQAADLAGDPRIAFGRNSLTVDMGAYEYYSCKVVGVIGGFSGEGGVLIWTWASRPGKTYAVWSCLDLSTATWKEKATVPSKGATTFWADTTPTGRAKFYRVGMK
ncbi:hypothetical protein HQ563_17010 [bacterium]|nr:hypothetical protein [bacterium]